MHSRRRRAFGLAALSLTATGVVLGHPGEAPGTAKEPRPASHFRLVLQGVEGAGLMKVKGTLIKDSITLREIAPRQVFTYKAGRRVARRLPVLERRLADTFTRGEATQLFLGKLEAGQTFLSRTDALAGFLQKPEAEATYAKKGEVVAGDGSVLTGRILATQDPNRVLELPGIGELKARTGANGAHFALETSSTAPILVNSSQGRGGRAVAGAPYETDVAFGKVDVLQIIIQGGLVASVTLSIAEEATPVVAAQALIGAP